MGGEVDELVCALTPESFYGVGMWYDDFTKTTDAGVRNPLGRTEPARVLREKASAGTAPILEVNTARAVSAPTTEEAKMTKDHGPQIKDDEQYEALRRDGMSKDELIRALRNH